MNVRWATTTTATGSPSGVTPSRDRVGGDPEGDLASACDGGVEEERISRRADPLVSVGARDAVTVESPEGSRLALEEGHGLSGGLLLYRETLHGPVELPGAYDEVPRGVVEEQTSDVDPSEVPAVLQEVVQGRPRGVLVVGIEL